MLRFTILQKECYTNDVWGNREEKYKFLTLTNFNSIQWQEIKPNPPQFFFAPKNFDFQQEYEKLWCLPAIFPIHTSGVKTHRDHFVIDLDRNVLKTRIARLRDTNISEKEISDIYKLENTGSWNLASARNKLLFDEKWEEKFCTTMYRPFDTRWIFYDDNLIERSRREVIQHMLKGDNIGIVADRSTSSDASFDHIFISNELIDVRSFVL